MKAQAFKPCILRAARLLSILLLAGLSGTEKTAQIDTYRVRITSHQPGDDIPESLPVTFQAEKDPPGFESDITWAGEHQVWRFAAMDWQRS